MVKSSLRAVAAVFCTLLLAVGDAFVVVGDVSKRQQQGRSMTVDSKLGFGIPSFLTPKDDKDKAESSKSNQPAGKESGLEKKEVGWKGLVQLITAGAGAPFLGDFEGVDKETGKFMFSLEANNLVDEKGNSKQTSMPYFESGWVDPEDEARAAKGFKFPWQK
jgi:hypothetical protein